MKGYRFYTEMPREGSALALALDDDGQPIYETAESFRAYDRGGLQPIPEGYLAQYCRRISERKARELSPALFQELEKE